MLSSTETKDSIRDFFNKRHTSLGFMLRYSHRKFSQAAFHRFRVEIKKLKALLALLDHESADFSRKKVYAPIKKLYVQAGHVRELQVEKELIHTQIQPGQLGNFFLKLQNEIQQKRESFFATRTLKNRKKADRSLFKIGQEIEKLGTINRAEILQKSKEKIKNLLKEGIESHNAHELRIQLKLLKNLQEILGMRPLPANGPEEELMKLLGDWHDLEVLVQRMNHSPLKKDLPAEEKKDLEKVIRALDSKRSNLLTDIQIKAPSLLT
ncbi:CHAD domain-containing protein [Algoriphagus taiwanensis]|uniref:CHAD domain-containing protein n=1 Tax=Algoriphagus taiwanensis TaxID=1445656 RepID=A0ABQ6Q0V5_9BACT|nr:hypothetical protein Ataiwa_14320 [Algoriphagus taiwanensis]